MGHPRGVESFRTVMTRQCTLPWQGLARILRPELYLWEDLLWFIDAKISECFVLSRGMGRPSHRLNYCCSYAGTVSLQHKTPAFRCLALYMAASAFFSSTSAASPSLG